MIDMKHIPSGQTKTAPMITHLAATATEEIPFWIAPFNLKVTGVNVGVATAVTGQDTNYTTLSIINGSTVVATLDLTDGNDLTADTQNALTLSSTAANLLITAGSPVYFKFTKEGSGLLVPPSVVEVQFVPYG